MTPRNKKTGIAAAVVALIALGIWGVDELTKPEVPVQHVQVNTPVASDSVPMPASDSAPPPVEAAPAPAPAVASAPADAPVLEQSAPVSHAGLPTVHKKIGG
jgi:hypothetical protein